MEREVFQQLVDKGYIEGDGAPIMCLECNGRNFIQVKEDYIEGLLVEYMLRCSNCLNVVGHWAYGSWQM